MSKLKVVFAVVLGILISVGLVLALTLAQTSQEASSDTASPTAEAQASETSASPSPEADVTQEAEPATPQATPSVLTLAATGDIVLHLSVNDAARTPSGYDYTPLMEQIRPWISGADLALCNLEVPIVPPGEKPSNYPMFGSPPEIAASLKNVGYDGCSTATNHSLDRGFKGVQSTLDTLDSVGLGHAGTARSEAEAGQIQFYKLTSGGREVKIAHLSATTLTNGIPLPKAAPYSWNVIGQYGKRSVEDVIADARRARELGADLVVLSMHWGTEYVSQPIEEQRTIAAQLAASGQVDLVLGNHSHVPEPVAKLDGGPDGQGMWVIWSHGNMISGQTKAHWGPRVLAGILSTATIDVPASGPAHVRNLEWTVITHAEKIDRLYFLHQLAAGNNPRESGISAAEVTERAKATYPVMSGNGSAERTTPPTPVATVLTQERL